MARMTEDELKAIVDAEMRQCVGFAGGVEAAERQKAEYYYYGLPIGDLAPPEIDGRSKVVSTDVRNTIESMLPALMAKFVSGDSVVEFEPTKEGDEKKAQIATDYMNYLFFKKNSGHAVTYSWFKDGLWKRNGIIKVWWDTREEESREEYRGLTEMELAQLMDDDEIEPIEQNTYPDEDDAKARQEAMQQMQAQLEQAMLASQQNPQAAHQAQQIQQQLAQIQQMPPVMLYDVAFKRVKTAGRLTIENVPLDEFLINASAKTIEEARFVGHRVKRTVSELNSMGYDTADLSSDDIENVDTWAEKEFIDQVHDSSIADESQRVIWVTECYLRVDYDGDGISELRKITRAGNKVLDNESVDLAPFISICPIPIPHQFGGMSIADFAMEPQRQKTAMLRAYYDNLYLQVNGRYFAVENQVNIDDLLNSQPGGVVRMKSPNMAGRLDQGMADMGGIMNGLGMMEEFLENSTGWTRYSQGNDSDSLNKTATGINIITNRADMRVELIARHFAEGFIDLFRMMLKLVCQNQDKEEVARLGGEWVNVDPREWRNQFDLSINVGLGSNNKDQQAAHVMNIMAVQKEALMIGVATPENIYNSACEVAKLSGFKSGDRFFTDPSKAPPQPPQPDPEAAKIQAQQQTDQAKIQAQAQAEQMKLQSNQQIEQMKLQYQQQCDDRAAELEKYKAGLDAMQKEKDREFEMWKARLQAETTFLTAQLGKQSDQSGEGEAQGKEGANDALAAAMQGFTAALSQMQQPRTIIRGPDGRAEGIV